MKRYYLRNLSLIISLIWSVASAAAQENLSQLALFYRCYAHLTQLRPAPSNPLLAQVATGTKTALQACTELLDKGRFTADGGTKIQDNNDIEAKAVLYTFHQLHRSWAREQSLFSPLDDREDISTSAWFEDSPYGAYVTRALFSPDYDVSSIVHGSDYLQPVRVTMSPAPSFGGVPSTSSGGETEFRLGAQQPFAPRGQLLGIRTTSVPPISFFAPIRFTNLSSLPDFANIGLLPKASQSITNVNFVDITAVKGPLVEIDQFAIQIRGSLQITTPGSYRLFLNVDDGGALFIDQNRIINQQGTGEGFADISLTSGSHSLEVQYRQRTGSARLIFNWQGPGITKQVVPASALSNLQADYYTESQPPPFKPTGHEGGGFMGSHNYLLTSFLEADRNYLPNGAERTNRSWSRAVLRDSLCRDVPVIREADAEQFVVPSSTTPFRQAATCSSCHASLDRQAGLIRGLRWNPIPTVSNDSPVPDQIGIVAVNLIAPSLPALTTWPDLADPDYGKRQPYGHLYFRNYKGELVDRVVRSIEELGTAITDQDDFYSCLAKRYYFYLLGIEVELGDPGSSLYPPLNATDQYHRSKVIDLGLRLKTDKSLRQLILDIIAMPEYRMSDSGISFKGTNP